ncbi:MAG: DUF4296 domain-containing protein [Cytophagales bacterium]|nr:DUF4296 domain-containing protein [Bernardetiaceae bacterium]MDW8211076.1 DUF4296 domain-containing protein [Cytophagales bacterium]
MRRGLGWGMICIAMLGGWSCSQKEHAPPREGVLPLPTIASILADIHLAEAAVAMQALTFQESLSRYDYYEREIMRRHQTDTATYRRSYEFYAADANQLAQLMKIVADTLTARRKALH